MQLRDYIGLFIYKTTSEKTPSSTEYTARKLHRKYRYKYCNRVKILPRQYIQLMQMWNILSLPNLCHNIKSVH